MNISRRKALSMSGATLAGYSLGVLRPGALRANQPEQQDWPDTLVERPLRDGFPAPLPLNADGSAPEHLESEAGSITEPQLARLLHASQENSISYRPHIEADGGPLLVGSLADITRPVSRMAASVFSAASSSRA